LESGRLSPAFLKSLVVEDPGKGPRKQMPFMTHRQFLAFLTTLKSLFSQDGLPRRGELLAAVTAIGEPFMSLSKLNKIQYIFLLKF
jgi:hypothetical protein